MYNFSTTLQCTYHILYPNDNIFCSVSIMGAFFVLLVLSIFLRLLLFFFVFFRVHIDRIELWIIYIAFCDYEKRFLPFLPNILTLSYYSPVFPSWRFPHIFAASYVCAESAQVEGQKARRCKNSQRTKDEI